MTKRSTNILLKRLYFDVKNPAGYGGITQLWKKAKEFQPSLKKADVKFFLESQSSYNKTKPFRIKFKRRKILARHLNQVWEIDLVDMSAIQDLNGNMRFILTAIDVLSRFAMGVPIKNKQGITIRNGLKTIFKKSGRKPVKIHSDRGTEFYNSVVLNFLKSENIILYSSFSEMKCAILERWHRTLKNRMFRYFIHNNTLRWIDILDDLILSYNNRPHKTLRGAKPIDVTESNQKKFWRMQFERDNTKIPLYNLNGRLQSTKQNLDQNALLESNGEIYKLHLDTEGKFTKRKTIEKAIFKIGDKVRLLHKNKTFRRGFHQSFTTEIFEISQINYDQTPITYVIKDVNGEVISGKIYKEELSLVRTNE